MTANEIKKKKLVKVDLEEAKESSKKDLTAKTVKSPKPLKTKVRFIKVLQA